MKFSEQSLNHLMSLFYSRYKYEDEDDVDDMEANFTTIMKEEARRLVVFDKPLMRQSQQKSSAFLICWNV